MADFKKIEQILNIKVTGTSEINQLSSEIELLKKKQKDLRKANAQTSNQFTENKVKLKALSAEYNKASKEIGRLATGTKKATSFTGKLTSSMLKMTAGVASASFVFQKLSQAVGNMIADFKSFEFSMAKVKAISGATGAEFAVLERAAMKLGGSTMFTATNVAQLQLNLSKLGFSAREIIVAEEAILNLATATTEDLARSATVVASTIRGFGLDASEAARVANVMGKAFTSSALDLEKFQTSMTKISPVAKLLGFTVEETTALLATLTDAGIEASIAGTSLRNIMIELGDPTSNLSERMGGTVHSAEQLVAGLKDLNLSETELKDITGLVAKRQVAAFGVMINGADAVENLTNKLNDQTDAIGVMRGIIEQTTEGALVEMNSALEKLNITIGQSTGGIIPSFVKGITEIFNGLSSITKATGNFTTALLSMVNGNFAVVKTLSDVKNVQDEYNEAIEAGIIPTRTLDSERLRGLALLSHGLNEAIDTEGDLKDLKGDILEETKMQLKAQQEVVATNETELAQKNRDIQLIEDKIDRLRKLGRVEEEAKKKKKVGISDKAALGIKEGDIGEVVGAKQKQVMEDFLSLEIKTQVDIDNMKQQMFELEIERLRLLGDARMELGMYTLEMDNKILDLKVQQQQSIAKTADVDTKSTQEMMQNAIMNSDNANQAFRKVLTTKINEILLDAMSSMFKDGSIPFVAKLGLALGMKSIVSPMISNMLGGGGKFANGGLTDGGMFQGASHANGGVKFAVGGRIHEAEGGEAIINKRSTSMFKPLLSAINSHNNYGKKFAMGGLTEGIQSKYAIGGMTASSLGDIVSGGGMGGSQTVMVVESDITRTQSRVSAIEAQASF